MSRKEQHIRAIKLLVTILLSVVLVALFVMSKSVFVQWLIIVLVGGGVYLSVDRLFANFYSPENMTLSAYTKAIYSEVFVENNNACFIVTLPDLEIIELNRVAENAIDIPQRQEPVYLESLWDSFKEDIPTQWLDRLRNKGAYDSCVAKLKLKETLGQSMPRLCTLAFIPFFYQNKPCAIIKVINKALLLSDDTQSKSPIGRLDVTRHAEGMAYWELDLTSQQLYFCTLVAKLLGLDDTFESPIDLNILRQRADTAIFDFILQLVKKGFRTNPLKAQKMLIDRSGNQSFVYMQAQYYPDENFVIGSFLDITPIKQLEIKLRQQEQQTNQLVDSIPEGIMVLQNNKVVYLNRASQKLFGIDDLSDSKNLLLADFVSDHDKALLRDRIKYMLAGKKSSYGFTSFTLRRSDGEYFDAEVAVNLIIYEGTESVQFVIRDLTDVLRVKNALARANYRLSALSSKTLQLIETERKQIAGELHDDVGQSLTAVLLATKWITRRVEDEQILSKIADIHQITSQTLDTVRNLSLLLRPAQLDSLGFSPAIKWQMEKLFSIDEINYQIDDKDFKELRDKQAEIVGFRIVQESLTNIVKHARAKNVRVTLFSDENILIIQISDDGIGFDVHAQSDSVGLINMKERVELAGGEFKIFSKPLLGTDIKVEIPLRNTDSGLDSY